MDNALLKYEPQEIEGGRTIFVETWFTVTPNVITPTYVKDGLLVVTTVNGPVSFHRIPPEDSKILENIGISKLNIHYEIRRSDGLLDSNDLRLFDKDGIQLMVIE